MLVDKPGCSNRRQQSHSWTDYCTSRLCPHHLKALGALRARLRPGQHIAVVGGGFSQVAADYVDHIRAAVDERAVNAFARAVRVERAALAGDAPLIGAAALVHRSDLLV